MKTTQLEKSEINFTARLYIVALIIALLGWVGMNVFYQYEFVRNIIIIGLVVTGGLCVFGIYKHLSVIITPISIFLLIWFILLPITSKEYPMMAEMTQREWNYCLAGCTFFILGALLSCAVSSKMYSDRSENYESWHMSKFWYNFSMVMIVFSILVYFILMVIAGGFPAMSSDPNQARNAFFSIPGSALISNLGFFFIFLIFSDKIYRKKKIFIICLIIYFAIQLLITVRFMLIICTIALISSFSERKIDKKTLKVIVFLMLAVMAMFFVVTSFRGGIDEKQYYFIDSGRYSGTAKELVETEIFRYFGMSQRTMLKYIDFYTPGVSKMAHTFAPIATLIGTRSQLPVHFGISGYTACNIITYFYWDAGEMWWIMMIAWSFIVNTMYFRFKNNPQSIVSKYLWVVSAISLTMSFYCYIDAYPYWCCHYLIILFIISKLKIKTK